MAKLTRKLQKIFSETSSENGQFGSGVLGTKLLSDDIDTLQSLSAWLGGWSSAVVGGQKLPTLEEMNAIQYTVTRQIKYLFEQGIPEYLSTENYFIGSIVVESGTYKVYGSLTDDNLGNALTDTSNWKLLLNLNPEDRIANKSADYTITDTDGLSFILVDGSTSITLPDPGENIGREITIKRNDSSNLTKIIRNDSSDLIDNVNDDYYLGHDMQAITLIAYDSNNWYLK